jgi:hypothetical protein
MNGDGRPMNRRQRRGGAACNGAGPGRGRGKDGPRGSASSLSGRTTTSALVAVGAYVAQDLRDAEGLVRPLLRRAALRLALSRREPARRLGSAYLRLDPPDPSELPKNVKVIDTTGSSSPSRALPPAPGHAEAARPDNAPAR